MPDHPLPTRPATPDAAPGTGQDSAAGTGSGQRRAPGLAGRALLGALALLLLQGAGQLLRQDDGDGGQGDRSALLAQALLLAWLALAAGGVWAAHRAAQALRRLTLASERLAQGAPALDDAQAALQADARRSDEIGALARALAGQQRALHAQQAQWRRLADTDSLTGLPNLRQLRDALQQAVGAGPAAAPLLLRLELDRFAHVQSVLGQAAGDRLLLQVTDRLAALLRDGAQADPAAAGCIARLDGAGFALLLPRCSLAGGLQLAQRIAAALARPLMLDDQSVALSASLGLAAWPLAAAPADAAVDPGSAADALLQRAGLALAEARRGSGADSGCVVYDPVADSASAVNQALLAELRLALARDELALHLQPVMDIATGAVCSAEALLRWDHPQRGLLQPLLLVPRDEPTGLGRQLTRWLIDRAADAQVALALLGVRRVTVRLSARDLLDAALGERLDAVLRRRRALADGFCLGFDAAALLADPQRAELALQRLTERGFHCAIEDFGSGAAAPAALQRLAAQALKIDRRHVSAMAHDAAAARIVRATIDLARELGLGVVADGVENAHLLSLLHTLGCDRGQGGHLCPALPLAECEDWIARWQARAPVAAFLPAELRAGAPLLH